MGKIQQLVDRLDPQAATIEIAQVMRKLFGLIDEKARVEFLMNVIGDAATDKVGGLVHLWLATCMDEGVDPKDMCRGLMDKVAQSEQLMAVADPDVLVLFEDWLEELEDEVVSAVQHTGSRDAYLISEKLGLSYSGASFLITKLKREGKL